MTVHCPVHINLVVYTCSKNVKHIDAANTKDFFALHLSLIVILFSGPGQWALG